MLSRELVAAATQPLLLAILAEGENYGYALIRRVKEVSGGKLEWTEGTLYPVLHRLEKDGLLEAFWKEADNGRRREILSPHSFGKDCLEDGARALAIDLSSPRNTLEFRGCSREVLIRKTQLLNHMNASFQFDQAMAAWRSATSGAAQMHASHLDELETHLRDTYAELREIGLPEEEAFHLARRRLGDTELAAEFAKVHPDALWRERGKWMLCGLLRYQLFRGHVMPALSF